jgi:hypothetical protein
LVEESVEQHSKRAKEEIMPHYAQGTTGWTQLKGYQALWDPKIDLGKFYFTTFDGKREETPYMTAENFARVIDILRNESPVYGNASTGSVTTQAEGIGDEES